MLKQMGKCLTFTSKFCANGFVNIQRKAFVINWPMILWDFIGHFFVLKGIAKSEW